MKKYKKDIREDLLMNIVKLYKQINSAQSPITVKYIVENIIENLDKLSEIDSQYDYKEMIRELFITIDEEISREIIEYNHNAKKMKNYQTKKLHATHTQIFCAIYDILSVYYK